MSLFDAIFGKSPDYSAFIQKAPEWKWERYAPPMGSLSPAIIKKCLELLGDCDPATNIVPTALLVQEAWRMGYEVIRKPKAEK